MAELVHTPERPGFGCAVCRRPWPCPPAKVQLSEEYAGDLTGLCVYLSAQLGDAIEEAVRDHNWGRVDDLYDRFVSWARRPVCWPQAEQYIDRHGHVGGSGTE
ncbi:flavin reductase [Actinoplanes sp. URMC 104]|uniref:flavin reductase n=1 Tax=Actinoplanes sp. URMC 104 TaxID=3423409 RepID=UPI003F1D3BCE